MKVITERDEIRAVAFRWASTYSGAYWLKDKKKQDIATKLKAMDPETATREMVTEIIGNDSWIDISCDECHVMQRAVLHFGDEPDREARWQMLCGVCLAKAVSLLKEAK